jgi:hypothetical protein
MPVIIDGTNGLTFPDNSRQYNGYFGFKNRIINGDMRIDQRNAGASVDTSNTAGAIYTIDRWAYRVTAASKFTIQRNAGSVTPPAGFTNYLGCTSSSAYSVTSSDTFNVWQTVEGFNVSDLGFGSANAQTVTLSFWVRSSLTGTFSGAFRNNAGNRSYVFTYTISAANTWEQKTVTIPGDTSGTWETGNSVGLYVQFSLGVGSTFATTAGSWQAGNFFGVSTAVNVVGTNGATFYVTGVQLEEGVVSTNFDVLPYGTQLQLCQRYYYRITPDNSKRFGSGFAYLTTEAMIFIPFMTQMRTAPSALEQSGTATDYRLLSASGSGLAGTSVPTFNTACPYNATVSFYVGGSLVAGNGTMGFPFSSTSYLAWSAEL